MKIILRLLLPLFLDFLISILKDLAKRTDNEIDDHVVESLETNKNIIIEASKIL
jgi:hypothetical protein